jgi:hypothetical protein
MPAALDGDLNLNKARFLRIYLMPMAACKKA